MDFRVVVAVSRCARTKVALVIGSADDRGVVDLFVEERNQRPGCNMAGEPLNECEYRFDRVPEGEREECFNYEFERELTRRGGNQPAPAWLSLSERAKRDYRHRTRIDLLAEREPVSVPSSILPSDCETVLYQRS
jgi:hypothetical protein